MNNTEAWNYAIGMIKVDGLEPTEDFKKYIEKEKKVKQLWRMWKDSLIKNIKWRSLLMRDPYLYEDNMQMKLD